MKSLGLWSLLVLWCVVGNVTTSMDKADVVVFAVASNETDGFKRYLRSVRVNGFSDKLKILGLNEPWKGGDMNHPGGGYKTNLLKKALEEYKNDKEKIVIFTDSYDVIFLGGLDAIVEKFKTFKARVLFSAEESCWPDKSLRFKYPPVGNGKRYLNSGGFMGYASDLHELLETAEIRDKDDDQLFYTKLYLDEELRSKHEMKLDHRSEIFQNLWGAIDDVALQFGSNEVHLRNAVTDTSPLVVHGNGLSKLTLNSLGNYLAGAWNPKDGCLGCRDDNVELPIDETNKWPSVLIAVYVDVATPFLEEFFEKIGAQSYPKSKIHVFVYNNVRHHEKLVSNFVEKHGGEYESVKQILPNDNIEVAAGRQLAMDHCLLKGCSGYFSIDSVSHLDNEDALKLLVEQQRGIVAPLLVRPLSLWSNFWGAITDDGFYARSSDYLEIVQNNRRGLWNVPYVANCYLINATVLKNPATRPSYVHAELDPDMAFALSNRKNDVFMFVSNRFEFGHLVNPEDYDTKLTNPDMYEIFNNKFDWENRYIHENYSASFDPDKKPIQPCTDVYWFPIFTERFTEELIELVESFGQWSDGSNHDPRLEGGYENVPTRDIHMKQVLYERHWLHFLKEYVMPLQKHVFIGYEKDPPQSYMNFVVRYRPDEQPSLRPHHDASTYTINIALNRAGIDYEGGGCRYIRYNCSVTDTKRGWMLMHPGRLTHMHEGLVVTKGTRYIMISFIDP